MKHKQDRHNCSVLVNLKLFLSDLSRWRVHISGSHVPPDSGLIWHPPNPSGQRLDEDARDVIMKYSREKESSANIAEFLVKQDQMKGHDQTSSRKRVSYFVSGMKKRRRERDYNFAHKAKRGKSGMENVSTSNMGPSVCTASSVTPGTSSETYVQGQQTIALEVPEPGQTVTYTIVGPYQGHAGAAETWPGNVGTDVEGAGGGHGDSHEGALQVQGAPQPQTSQQDAMHIHTYQQQ